MRLLTAQAGCGAAPVPPPAESRARLTDHAPTAAAAHASQPRPPNIFLMAEENRHESLRGTGASSSRAAHLNSQGTPACRAAAPEGGGEPADLTRPADLAGPRRVVAGPRLPRQPATPRAPRMGSVPSDGPALDVLAVRGGQAGLDSRARPDAQRHGGPIAAPAAATSNSCLLALAVMAIVPQQQTGDNPARRSPRARVPGPPGAPPLGGPRKGADR